jgi:hypothetical protein
MRTSAVVGIWVVGIWVVVTAATASLGAGCDVGSVAAEATDAAPAAPDARPPLVVDESRKICDGSDGLRFAIRTSSGFLPPEVAYELGSFLFVDGHCHFWVPAPSYWSGLLRTGVLDAAQEAELASTTYFQSWASLDEPLVCITPPPTDGDTTWLTDGTIIVSCPYCESNVRPELSATCQASFDLRTTLADAGAPLDGPVRVRVTDGFDGALDEVDWPLAQDPAELVAASAAAAIEIDDLDTAAALRALIVARVAADPHFAGALPVRTGDGRHFRLDLRDLLPFEDGVGHVLF